MAAEKNGFGSALRVGGGTLTLLGIYLITNLDLLRTLTGEGFTTHRQEMVLRAAEHPLTSFWELIFSGGSYSPVYSAGILAARRCSRRRFWRCIPEAGGRPRKTGPRARRVKCSGAEAEN